ncbi:MAG: dTMP kinase [Anaerolineae bacterium]|nr:dTMP kinase [Thermoflexales bacterium]MDW8395621.1 dTMP kinase [Anaerolineae bacterium]
MLITLEGLDGSGKTTQARRLADWLSAQGADVLLTREPGGTAVGDAIRALLADPAHAGMEARAELMLFCASRAQLVAERIRPHLDRGGVVVCDRFADSTLAYQGYGRGLDLAFLRALLDFTTGGLTPDLTLYFDLPPELGLSRRRRQGTLERMETEQLAFYQRVRQGYLELASQSPARWCVIDATQPEEIIAAAVRAFIAERLPKRPDSQA